MLFLLDDELLDVGRVTQGSCMLKAVQKTCT